MLYLVSYLVTYAIISREKRERAGCFTLIIFLLSCGCKYSVSLAQGAVVGLQCEIVAFLANILFLSVLFAKRKKSPGKQIK